MKGRLNVRRVLRRSNNRGATATINRTSWIESGLEGVRLHSRGAISPELCADVSPGKSRAQGKPGACYTRGLACKMKKHTSVVTTGSDGNNPTFPAQWAYGLLRALPGERILVCHRRRRRQTPSATCHQQRVSGPHDLAVRFSVFVQRANARLTPKRPSHPAPNVS